MGIYKLEGKNDTLILHTTFNYPAVSLRVLDWSCIDDNYDGAPDAEPQIVGAGTTEIEAIKDYLDQYLDKECNNG